MEETNSENTDISSSQGIDVKDVNALAKTDFVPEPFWRRVGNEIVTGLIQFGLFLLGIILDIFKALWTLISGIFIYLYKGIIAIGHFFRKAWRIFKEVDGWGRGGFVISGLGQMKYGQIYDGLIFLAVEALFILYFVTIGITSLQNLVNLSTGYKQSPKNLVLGILTIIITLSAFFVHCKSVQGMYDDYQILHNFQFLQAHEDQLHVLRNRHHYSDIDFYHESALSIRKKFRHQYGYSWLSSTYISYVPFKRLRERKPSAIRLWWNGLVDKLDARYNAVVLKVKNGKWSSAFANVLMKKRAEKPSRYGSEAVTAEVTASLTHFHHTYDKYNDYLSYTRDLSAEIDVLAMPKQIILAAYAEDEVSKRNGLTPIPHGTALKAKEVVSRIVGLFNVSLPIARDVSKLAVAALKAEAAGKGSALDAITRVHDRELARLNAFTKKYSTDKLAEVAAVESVYRGYATYRSLYDQGRNAWIKSLAGKLQIEKRDAIMLFKDYGLSIKDSGDDEKATVAALSYRADHYHKIVVTYQSFPFHGQPLRMKKHLKQYGDERFAVTVLSLPVLGAIITCILPLIFSIAVAFTNWDSEHTNKTFTWDMSAFNKLLGLGGSSDFSMVFGKILLWTLVWAFFATFTNYIFGILLALIINKKGIRLKKMWRTIFVVTIAIPQFIMLLIISVLLGQGGAVNTWFESMGWKSFPFLGSLTSETSVAVSTADYIIPKITVIVINMWVGIPYTMLSTSGILMNIPEDLYESSRIDGAGAWTQFWKITMPYILFVTGPSLLTTFIGNINNFNVIYLLTGGNPEMYDVVSGDINLLCNPGHTDLLITWLYKLSYDANGAQYNVASVIGIIVFVICAFFSLIMYKRLGSVQNEEEFQ